MSIKETIEAARFPVHKSGGYQIVAVDDLLVTVIEEAEGLEDSLASERSKRGALDVENARLRSDLSAEQAKVMELEVRVADLEAASPLALSASSSPDVEALEKELSEVKAILANVKEQLEADEEHITSMEEYADVLEKSNATLKAERDKIRADAEAAILSLTTRLKATEPQPEPVREHEAKNSKPDTGFSEVEELDDIVEPAEPVYIPSVTTPVRTTESTSKRPRLLRRK